MAKIKPIDIIRGMRGKVCEHSDMYFRMNKQTSEVFTGKVCNPTEEAASEGQMSARERFKKVALAVRARIAALEGEAKEKLVAAYKAQHKIGSLFGYCYKKWNKEYDEEGEVIE